MKLLAPTLLLAALLSPASQAQSSYAFAPLTPADQPTLAQITTLAARQKLKQAEIFEKQSFRLMQDGKPVATFITGRYIPSGDPDSLACFVTMVEPNRPPKLMMTVGEGDIWNRCGIVKSLGLVDTVPSPQGIRIGLLYDDSLVIPDTNNRQFLDTIDALVLLWNAATHQLTFDETSTSRANQADAKNLPALLRALR